MSGFGDYDEADALDTEPADAAQVARKLHQLRRREGMERVAWDELSEAQRLVRLRVVMLLLAWLRRQGAT